MFHIDKLFINFFYSYLDISGDNAANQRFTHRIGYSAMSSLLINDDKVKKGKQIKRFGELIDITEITIVATICTRF